MQGVAIMSKTTYSCPRCGYSTDRINNYAQHVARARTCKAILRDVVPTLENVVRSDAGQLVPVFGDQAQNLSLPITGDNNHVDVTANNNNIQNNTQNIHNNNNFNMPVLPLGQEDKSHVTARQWQYLMEQCTSDADGAMRLLANMVHFNPAKPNNMNVFFPQLGHEAAYFGGDPPKWRWEDKNNAAERLLDQNADALKEYAHDANPALCQRAIEEIENAVEEALDNRSDEAVELACKMMTGISEVVRMSHPERVDRIVRRRAVSKQ